MYKTLLIFLYQENKIAVYLVSIKITNLSQYFGSKSGAIPKKKLLIVPPPSSAAVSSSSGQNSQPGSGSSNSQFGSSNVVSISHRSFELSSGGDVTSGSSSNKNELKNLASYSR